MRLRVFTLKIKFICTPNICITKKYRFIVVFQNVDDVIQKLVFKPSNILLRYLV